MFWSGIYNSVENSCLMHTVSIYISQKCDHDLLLPNRGKMKACLMKYCTSVGLQSSVSCNRKMGKSVSQLHTRGNSL